jgi:hypothetical protein
MRWSKFLVDERPYCMWGWDLPAENLRFLDGLDPKYFNHVSDLHAAALDSDGRQYAALALRLAYSQALETFFALLGAALQAPQCAVGWMLAYTNFELRNVVQKLSDGAPLKGPVTFSGDWDHLSREIHLFELDDRREDRRIKSVFAILWKTFAFDFLDERFSDEYNSMKHGLRVRPGGFWLTIGGELEDGGTDAPSAVIDSRSEYGSRFFRVRSLAHKRTNFSAVEAARNWDPVALAVRIELLSVSIGNVISYLKVKGGTTEEAVQFNWPIDDGTIDLVWKADYKFASIEGGRQLEPEDIEPMTKAEILKTFE